MNKNNKTVQATKPLTLLIGLLLSIPALQADNNAPLQYIDASGNVRIIQDDVQSADNAMQPDTEAAPAPYQETYTEAGYSDAAPETYAEADPYAALPDHHINDGQGVHGNSGPPQPKIIYYDAETGQPVPAEQVGVNYFTGQQQDYTQQPAAPAQTYSAPAPAPAPAPAQPTQLEPDVVYVDAITGETLTAQEAQEALAYNAAQQQGATNYNAAQQEATNYNTPMQAQATNAHAALPPAPQSQNAGSGYAMYADTKASADQPGGAIPQQSTAPQRPTVSAAAVVKAVEAGRIDILSSLQAQGADLRASDAQGLTYLHRAAAAGHVKMAKYLLRVGLNPNASTSKNWTPLHHAARFGHAEVVAALLAAGADERQMTSDGFSAKRLALNAKKYQVAGLLR